MSTVVPAPVSAPTSFRFRPALLLLFAGSGAAALIYEVVWFHLLRLVVGSSAVSLGFLLGSFMGGMCLGSLLLPRLLSPRLHPLRVYALLELGIGAIGLLLPTVLPALSRYYTDHVGEGLLGFTLRGCICALVLLLPTMMMGATLPAIARWLDTSRQGIGSLGRFYGANIFGAIAGTLLAGFYLLRVYDTMLASQVAAAVNGFVAVVALLLSVSSRHVPQLPDAAAEVARAPRHLAVHVAIAASGFTALGAEVVWTRLLSLLFGASVYTFSLILAVFLVGLGLGSTWGARLASRVASPRRALAVCQAVLVLAFVYTAFVIVRVIPYAEPTYVFQQHVVENPLVRLPWDFVRCTLAILPGPVLWGMSFPLALAAASEGQHDAGRLAGGVYAANTIGAIGGALLTSLAGIGWIGTQHTQQVLAAIAGATALLLVLTQRAVARPWRVLAAAALLALIPVAAARLPAVPNGMIAYGRHVGEWDSLTDYLYVAEGVSASVAVTYSENCLNFHVSGKVVASTERLDMRLQRMLGHLPSLIHGAPRSVLIVGCGAGVTAGTFTDYPSVRRIVVCEIEPKVIDGAREFLREANHGVLEDPRTEVVLDDARHFLATTKEKFDIITSDPIHPWVRGAAALYSSEYYELVKQHLTPGAIVTQWVPLYQADTASVKSQIGTFFQAFPHGTVWSSDIAGRGYDVVMMAQTGPMHIDVDTIADDLQNDAWVRDALAEVDLGDVVSLMKTFAGQASDLKPWLADAQLNSDVGLKLQYLAGLALDRYDDAAIYGQMKRYLRYPEDLFVASPELELALRTALAR
ncbi:MAG TPA: fused MFS/spermidine synthase [Planctomycetota bacterium]|nr:fused MFS/spermidine synthase [Planctomycetota bacterium]